MYDMIRNVYSCGFESFGGAWRKRKCKFFGHILRWQRDDPLYQITFSHNIFSGRMPLKLRPGRQRADWLRATYKDSYHYLHQSQTVFDVSDRPLLLNIQEATGNTMRPFSSHFSKDKTKKRTTTTEHVGLCSKGLWPFEVVLGVLLIGEFRNTSSALPSPAGPPFSSLIFSDFPPLCFLLWLITDPC